MKSRNNTRILIIALFFTVLGISCSEQNDEVTLKSSIEAN